MSALTLATLRGRVRAALMDASSLIWLDADLDTAIGEALRQLSAASPASYTAALTLTADGRELSLEALSDLIGVSEVWYPYTAAAAGVGEVFGICPFRFFWEADTPTLRLEPQDGRIPRAGEGLRLFYTGMLKLDGLDGATQTTLPGRDEALAALGAAGQAALSRALDLMETPSQDLYAVTLLAVWGRSRLKEFNAGLEARRAASARRGAGVSLGGGWAID